MYINQMIKQPEFEIKNVAKNGFLEHTRGNSENALRIRVHAG